MRSSETTLFPIPYNQFWLDTYNSFIELEERAGGACQGFAHISKNALLCGERKQTDIRTHNIYYGVPFSHPDVPFDPKRRVKLADLEQIVKDHKLQISEEKVIIHSPKADTSTDSEVCVEEVEKAFNDKMNAMGLLFMDSKQIPYNPIWFYNDNRYILDTMHHLIPAISSDELIKQISLAGRIRGAYIARLKTESKLSPVEIDKEKDLFDQKYPYLLDLINIGVHFSSIAAYQSPALYPWLFQEPLVQPDSPIIDKILSPVRLDDVKNEQVDSLPQIIRFQDTYSHEQLDCYFRSLEKEIHAYVEKNKLDDKLTDLPLTLLLSARAHIFSVGYQIKTKKWIVMDANESPSYEVDTSEIAKLILVKLSLFHWRFRNYPGLRFVMFYDKIKKEMILVDVAWNEEEAKNSWNYPKYKFAYEKLKSDGFIRDIRSTTLNLCTEIHTNAEFKTDMEKLISDWRESKEFLAVHELNLDKIKIKDEFSKGCQATVDSSKIAYWKKIRSEVVELKPQDFSDFLAKEGKQIDQQIKDATNFFELAEILQQLPNRLLWLEMTKRNIGEFERVIYGPGLYSYFKYRLGDDLAADEIRKIANLKRHSLCEAAQDGNLNLVKFLVEELKFPMTERVSLPGQSDSTALHCSAYYKKLPVLKYLLGKMDIDSKNAHGNTPLFLSVCHPGDLESIKWLVKEAKADMHCVNNTGKSPFSLAIELREKDKVSSDIADFLFWHDIKVRLSQVAPDKLGDFFSAQGRALAASIRLLINNSVQLITILNTLPNTLVMQFVVYFIEHISAVLRQESEFNKFTQNYQNSSVHELIQSALARALMQCVNAAKNGNLETLKYYIENYGINPARSVESKDYPGANMLHMAALGGDLEVVKYLCRTVHPESVDNNENTPLHLAIRSPGSLDVVKYLILEQKGDMHFRNKKGQSPFDIAFENGLREEKHTEIANFLFWHDVKARLKNKSASELNSFLGAAGSSLGDVIPFMITDIVSLARLILSFEQESALPIFFKRYEEFLTWHLRTVQNMNSFIKELDSPSIIVKLAEINYDFITLVPELMQTLIQEKKLDLNKPDSTGYKLWTKVAKFGKLDLVKLLVMQYKPDLEIMFSLIQFAHNNYDPRVLAFLEFHKLKLILDEEINLYLNKLPLAAVDDFYFNMVLHFDKGFNLPRTREHIEFINKIDKLLRSTNKGYVCLKAEIYIKQLLRRNIEKFYQSQNSSRFFSQVSSSVVSERNLTVVECKPRA